MIIIDQKQFEGREGLNPLGPQIDLNKSQIGNKSVFSHDLTNIS